MREPKSTDPTRMSDTEHMVGIVHRLVTEARIGVSDETAVYCLAVVLANSILAINRRARGSLYHESTLRRMIGLIDSADEPHKDLASSAEQLERIQTAPTPEADEARPRSEEANARKLIALKGLVLEIENPASRCLVLEEALAIAVAEGGNLENRFGLLVIAMDTLFEEYGAELEEDSGVMRTAVLHFLTGAPIATDAAEHQ